MDELSTIFKNLGFSQNLGFVLEREHGHRSAGENGKKVGLSSTMIGMIELSLLSL